MARIRHSLEQIINTLREAEVLLGQEMKIPEVIRQLGMTTQTYYRWRKEYGELKTDQAKKLKEMERENAHLKQLVADLALTRRRCRKSYRESSEIEQAASCGGARDGLGVSERWREHYDMVRPHSNLAAASRHQQRSLLVWPLLHSGRPSSRQQVSEHSYRLWTAHQGKVILMVG